MALAGMYWTAALDNFMPPGDAWPAVERSLVAAAALNSQLPDSHFGRAIKSFFADWAWSDADWEWQAASRLPDYEVQPELLLSHALARWALGDPVGALTIVRRARRIDPLSPVFIQAEASYLFHVGRLDEAAARSGNRSRSPGRRGALVRTCRGSTIAGTLRRGHCRPREGARD